MEKKFVEITEPNVIFSALTLEGKFRCKPSDMVLGYNTAISYGKIGESEAVGIYHIPKNVVIDWKFYRTVEWKKYFVKAYIF